jgi:hypothetical protein
VDWLLGDNSRSDHCLLSTLLRLDNDTQTTDFCNFFAFVLHFVCLSSVFMSDSTETIAVILTRFFQDHNKVNHLASMACKLNGRPAAHGITVFLNDAALTVLSLMRMRVPPGWYWMLKGMLLLSNSRQW